MFSVHEVSFRPVAMVNLVEKVKSELNEQKLISVNSQESSESTNTTIEDEDTRGENTHAHTQTDTSFSFYFEMACLFWLI